MDRSVVPDTNVVAETFVNEGDATVDMVGFVAVPPVWMLVPAPTDWTYVVAVERNWLVEAVDRNWFDRFVVPEMNCDAVTDDREMLSLRLTVGRSTVPPVEMLVPPWTRVLVWLSMPSI